MDVVRFFIKCNYVFYHDTDFVIHTAQYLQKCKEKTHLRRSRAADYSGFSFFWPEPYNAMGNNDIVCSDNFDNNQKDYRNFNVSGHPEPDAPAAALLLFNSCVQIV